MNYFKIAAASVTALLCFSSVVNADVSGLMNRIRENYNPETTMHAQFEHTIFWSIREREEKREGELFLAPGERFKAKLGNDLFVSDGETYWQYSKRNNQVIIHHLSSIDLSHQPSQLLSTYITNHSFEKAGHEDGFLVLRSTQSDQNYSSIQAWVDEESAIVKKLQLVDKNDNINTYLFRKTVFGNPVTPETFQFAIPGDTDVQDMRE
ncbi:outer membrane lipoprotein carrier protein LolA [Chitinispirillales bacterium ANBcel5]|uniref:LolA family protein n=1 Tax=Cellulosispirillum alkaliphilum TaxID=3039283 RepID=UPI002A50A816|nr:outer membrane lipoprotein carrier protein LolA [Chitinispirillales bacterium ANBcel5]